ncbi:MAG TPA: TetR/AcrR family transcriptional regulator [Capillimicrobium sp.]|nr:TetR/AcrR family transcriptional regulator [Capillimicrobium sp.]
MSPRRSVAEAQRTRERLVGEATAMASVEGLEGVTIGRLADATGLSKSGVTRHFPTKEELQLEALAHALDLFVQAVWVPAATRPAGLERLLAVCEHWCGYLAGDVFPGGCFLTAAAAEFDGREGRVRDAVRDGLERWLGVLAGEVRAAVDAGELEPGTDPAGLAYEILAFALAANQARQLLGDEQAPARSLALMRRSVLARAAERSARRP